MAMTYRQWQTNIKERLLVSNVELEQAIVVVYNAQEQWQKHAKAYKPSQSGVGFSGRDATLLSEYAIKILNGEHLNNKELAIARHRMPKYWRQIMRAKTRS